MSDTNKVKLYFKSRFNEICSITYFAREGSCFCFFYGRGKMPNKRWILDIYDLFLWTISNYLTSWKERLVIWLWDACVCTHMRSSFDGIGIYICRDQSADLKSIGILCNTKELRKIYMACVILNHFCNNFTIESKDFLFSIVCEKYWSFSIVSKRVD